MACRRPLQWRVPWFIRLGRSHLRIVADHWEEVRAGRWRLGLAVVGPNPAVRQVVELAEIARSTPDEAAFRAEVSRAPELSRRRPLHRANRLGAWECSRSRTKIGDQCQGVSSTSSFSISGDTPCTARRALGAREGLLRVCGRRSDTTSRREHPIYLRFSWWAPGDSNPEPAD